MSKITKIVFTGAPCSGKTTCLQLVQEHYKNIGIKTVFCPETATILINEGCSRDDMLQFETSVVQRQIAGENKLLSTIDGGEDILVLFDRGVPDCFSYTDSDALALSTGVTPASTWDRYDAAIFLESGAISGEYVSDSIRTEDAVAARDNHYQLLDQWLGHSHLRYIPYDTDISKKVASIIDQIDCVLSEKEIEKKYLIEYPNLEALEKYNYRKIDIEQTYLLSDVGSHRVRKRGYNGEYAYIETVKVRITESMCNEYEQYISEEQYNELLKKADPSKNTIFKTRYCFLFENKYMELDIFPFWDDKAFLEVELLSLDERVELPPEISVIKDVSNDKRYKNNYLASLKL